MNNFENFISEYTKLLTEKDIDKISGLYHNPSVVMNRNSFTAILGSQNVKEFYDKLKSEHYLDSEKKDAAGTFIVKKIRELSGSVAIIEVSIQTSVGSPSIDVSMILMGGNSDKREIVVQNFNNCLPDNMFKLSKAQELKNKSEHAFMDLAMILD
jgi:hypothetical protein